VIRFQRTLLLAGLIGAGSCIAQTAAQESAIRKHLAERTPQIGKIDEIRSTPVPGLFEVRVGTDILYSDGQGDFLMHGPLVDTRAKRNLTEERVGKLTAIDFSKLPLQDAVSIVRGDGKRKMAIFADPNCGYCKRFERDLQKVDNVTIHMFLYPVLGRDSADKSRNIWCAKDKGRAWLDWMVRDQPVANGNCDAAAIARNVEFGKRYKINGTPTLVFQDGTRVPGAVPSAQVEKLLAAAH
jgi:thiol:disulfide interchange protein DsbC